MSVRVVCDTAAARLGVDGVGLSVTRAGRNRGVPAMCSVRGWRELQVTVGEGPGAEVLAGGGPVLIGGLVLAARLGLGMGQAFALLRHHARTSQRQFSELARAVVEGALDPSHLSAPPGPGADQR